MFYVHAKTGYRPLKTVVKFKIKKLDKQSENCHDYEYWVYNLYLKVQCLLLWLADDLTS